MKLVVLKGGDEAVPLAQCSRASPTSTRAPGAVALSGDGLHWVLINVSPLVATQLSTDARLLRHPGLPDAAVRAVVLTDAQVDHVTGLLGLRDGAPIHLYATPAVFEELTHALPVLPLLEHYCGVQWHVIPVAGESREAVFHIEGQPTLEFTAVATDGPLPRHAAQPASGEVGDTIALAVRDLVTGQRFFCARSLAAAGFEAVEWMQQADCLLLGDDRVDTWPDDGGAWTTGLDMLAQLDRVGARRKVLMAMPDWEAGPGRLRGELARHGVELAADRMEINL
ncbi:MBL fold metallo-hydrolase [Sphaerotilus montanus]|uniref:MBL fold metallo-hydrolase n=1 Tax=Sphaerotilus montanus TaxID=522889 RepID=UPI003FA1F4D4